MKKRRIHTAIIAAACVAALSGCSADIPDAVQNAASVSRVNGHRITGKVIGESGRLYYANDFSFTVNSITFVPEYAGYTPENGNRLLDVFITENSVSGSAVQIGAYNFYILCDTETIWPLDPLDSSMMPLDTELEPGESVEYHMLYELPAQADDVKLVYIETDDDGNIDNMLTIIVEADE